MGHYFAIGSEQKKLSLFFHFFLSIFFLGHHIIWYALWHVWDSLAMAQKILGPKR
jgi:hypothetical protein